MVSVKPNIIFFGNERLATGLQDVTPLVLQTLLEHGYHVEAIISRYTPGRSRSNRPLEVEAFSNQHHIPLRKPTSKQELVETVRGYRADIGVLAAFGMLVPQEVIKAFPYGIINLHPSLLPKYRGTTPIEQAILDGADETGVSVMQLDTRMDAGPLLAQRAVKVTGRESKAGLAARLHELGAQLLVAEVESLHAGRATLTEQKEAAATFCSPLSKNDGVLNWQKPAIQLEREIRAYLGWPGSQTTLLGRELTVTQARAETAMHPGRTPGEPRAVRGEIWVRANPGMLVITRLKPAGKREMSAADFLRGQHMPA